MHSARSGRKGRSISCVAGDTPASTPAFTIVEVLVVLAIILILAGLILAASSYIHNKGARSRAEAEIAALSAALENYKADNGIYPRDPAANTSTDKLNARTMGNPDSAAEPYKNASLVLYRALSGDRNLDRVVTTLDQNFNIDGSSLAPALTQLPVSYFSFKPNQLSPTDQNQSVQFIRDPFGNSYGYSTAYQFISTTGYNPTFDLWSTSNLAVDPPPGNDTITPQWIKNW
jgi:prepilin-type N-terminal cleavage/methylation domain-containing protein